MPVQADMTVDDGSGDGSDLTLEERVARLERHAAADREAWDAVERWLAPYSGTVPAPPRFSLL